MFVFGETSTDDDDDDENDDDDDYEDDDDARDGPANVVSTRVDEREGRPFARARRLAGDSRTRERFGGAARDADARGDGDGAAAAGVARACTCARASARSTTGVGHALDFIGDATARSFEALRPRIDAESGVTPLSFVKRGVSLAQDAMGLVNGDRPEETLPTGEGCARWRIRRYSLNPSRIPSLARLRRGRSSTIKSGPRF